MIFFTNFDALSTQKQKLHYIDKQISITADQILGLPKGGRRKQRKSFIASSQI